MTQRKQHPDPISNQRFSLIDGSRAQIRVCRHWGRPIMIGVRHRRHTTGELRHELLLIPDGRIWNKILNIAKGE